MIDALAGRRREELRALLRGFDRYGHGPGPRAELICRHQRLYPRRLLALAAPPALEILGGSERLARLSSAPTVTIVGCRRASDYGMAMARSLARGLAVAGVTVASAPWAGIAVAAQEGALDAGGAPLAICGSGLQAGAPTRLRMLVRSAAHTGCAASELPDDLRGRRWGPIAAERVAVALASVVVVVEAADTDADLFGALLARRSAIAVAAMPGRITSPLSAGCHALLIDGATLVRGAEDVLEILGRPVAPAAPSPSAGLAPRLRDVLERVAEGCDTPERLCAGGSQPFETLAALGELELIGLLVRGDGGRYVPRDPAPRRLATAGGSELHREAVRRPHTR